MMNFLIVFFLAGAALMIPLALVLSVFPSVQADEVHAKWVKSNEKACWEENGTFEVSEYGIRCSINARKKNVFIKTYGPDAVENWSR